MGGVLSCAEDLSGQMMTHFVIERDPDQRGMMRGIRENERPLAQTIGVGKIKAEQRQASLRRQTGKFEVDADCRPATNELGEGHQSYRLSIQMWPDPGLRDA